MKEKIFIVEIEFEKVKTRFYFHNREKALTLYEHFIAISDMINDNNIKSVLLFSEHYCD